MEEAKEKAAAIPVPPTSPISRLLLFGLHLGTVYLIVYLCSDWLAGRFHYWILPLVDPGNRTSAFQFLFSHIFAFTFVPALVTGFVNCHYRPASAPLVWSIPAVILGYEFIAFPTTVFQNHFEAAFHHYFAGGFLIGEIHSYSDLFLGAGANPDMFRGMDQLHITGPFYAGLGYSLAALLVRHVRIPALVNLFPGATPQAPRTDHAEHS